MALTYRSPMEEIVAAFEPTVQSTIAGTAALCYKELEQENFRQFNFSLNAKAKEKLSTAGIYLSPYSAVPHSHPVCKTLENYILYKVLPSYLDNSFYFVGIKEFKLELLKKREKGLDLVSCINRYVTSADKLRYGSDFVKLCSKASTDLASKEHFAGEATLRDLVPITMSRAAKKLFLHDELHYWKKKNLLNFLEVLEPDILIGTVVYPPELLIGSPNSLNRWCYEYEVVGSRLHYYPDGVRGEGYEQPLEGGYLLKTNKIKTLKGLIYCVDVLCSKFSHHLIAITKGDAVTQSRRSFGNFEATSIRGLKHLAAPQMKFLPISFETVSKVYRYLRTLKKPDTQSAMAKLSQLLPSPTGFEIKFITEFSELVISTKGVRSMLCPSTFTNWLSGFGQMLPDCLKHRLSSVREISLDEFVTWFEPLCFSVDLKVVEHSTIDDILFQFSEVEVEKGLDLPAMMGNFEQGSVEMLNRCRTPYVGMAPLKGRTLWQVEIDGTLLVRVFARVLFNCYGNESGNLSISEQDVPGILMRLLERSMLIPKSKYKEDHAVFSSFVEDVISRAAAIGAQKRAWESYGEAGITWFNSAFRRTTLALCEFPNGRSSYGEFQQKWSVVVQNISSKGRFNCTRSVRKDAQPASGIVIPNDDATREVKEVEDSRTRVHVAQIPDVAQGKESALSGNERCVVSLPLKNTILECVGEILAGTPESSVMCCCDEVSGAAQALKVPVKPVPRIFDRILKSTEVNDKYNCIFMSKALEIGVEDVKFSYFMDLQEIASEILVVGHDVNCYIQKGSTIGLHNVYLNGDLGLKIRPAEHDERVRSIHNPMKVLIALAHVECEESSVGSEVDSPASLDRIEEETPHLFEVVENADGTSRAEQNLNGVRVVSESPNTERNFEEVDVPGDGNCFWHCLALGNDCNWEEAKKLSVAKLRSLEPKLTEVMERQIEVDGFAEDEIISCAAIVFGLVIEVFSGDYCELTTFDPRRCGNSKEDTELNGGRICMINKGMHFKLLKPLNNCLAEAVAQALRRSVWDVLKVMEVNLNEEINRKIWSGRGVNEAELDIVFTTFGIKAIVERDGASIEFNSAGRVSCYFKVGEEHISFVKKPHSHNLKLLRLNNSDRGVHSDSVASLALAGTVLQYGTSLTRAKALANSLFETSTGVLSSKLFNGRGNLIDGAELNLGSRNLVAILGTFGAGKSTLFKEFMRKNLGKAVDYVSPRKVLAQDFKEKMGLGDARGRSSNRNREAGTEGWKVSTFETFLMRAEQLSEGQALIIDEIQLYPPGYLDLVCILVKPSIHIFVVGDPCQSEYDNESDRHVFCDSKSDVERLLDDVEYAYNTLSLRFLNANYKSRIPCEISPSVGAEIVEPYLIFEGVESLNMVPTEFRELFLVSSFIEKKVVQCYVSQDVRVLTFGESTGITVQKSTILLTKTAEHASEKRWLTALSRARSNVCFVNASGLSLELLATAYGKRAFGRFITGRASLEDLKEHLPGRPRFKSGFYQQLGKNEGVMEEKLQGDPWLKCMVDLLQEEDEEEIEENLATMQDEWFKTHLPQCELESVRARWVHKILVKEAREVRMGSIVSEQFTDEHSKQDGQQLTNACERFETIYPRHKASDTVTFIMAVKKRLRFSTPAREKAKLFEACNYGSSLLKIFLEKIPLVGAHNPSMMARAKREFELKKTSKSAAVIENHSGRSCRDWLADVGLIFSKSQICTKFDNRFRNAKAAQTIVCFQHAVLCRFAPYMRYIEMKLQEVLPRKYYVHSGKKLEELDDWVKEGQFSGLCTESDYEAFDASQDQYIVAFELAVMRYLGLPRDLIEDYVYIKTHLGSKLGNFAIMRFSGEASTFLFNTMANMLFTFMRYSIKGNEYICFAGDDMCSSKRLTVKKDHENFLGKLKLKAKVQHTTKPTFCGWNLSPDGIYKKPQLVLERMCIAKELNNLKNCIDNYAIEVAFAYKLGEKAVMRMDEEELEAFYNCVRIIVKNKHMLKSDVVEVYQKGLEA